MAAATERGIVVLNTPDANATTTAELAGWHELKAVQRNRIFVADGNHYLNRPGPRIVESLGMLAEIFHPELFPSQYEGKGWMRYTAEPALGSVT
ncbi:MAG: hypothetical protein ACR2J1_04955 [Methyloceanibacter sp.]|uniref:hypothetical protein n=1 Tax=Methyloceanibacter sp. TaxID=1965321 RepID=UPI003D9AE4FC